MNSLKRKFDLYFNYLKYKQKYKKQVSFNGFTVVYEFQGSKTEFGERIIINSSFFSNLVGINHPTILIARDGSKILIGDNVDISAKIVKVGGKQ